MRGALPKQTSARALREKRRVDCHTTQAAGLAWALYPADKSSSIPMGFEFEKEAVGENPQVTDEFAAAVKRG